MKRRSSSFGRPMAEVESSEAANGVVGEIADPDPAVNSPQLRRSLHLLLDVAIIEGLQHGLPPFAYYLKLAEAELSKVAVDGGDRENAGDDGPLPAKPHRS